MLLECELTGKSTLSCVFFVGGGIAVELLTGDTLAGIVLIGCSLLFASGWFGILYVDRGGNSRGEMAGGAKLYFDLWFGRFAPGSRDWDSDGITWSFTTDG